MSHWLSLRLGVLVLAASTKDCQAGQGHRMSNSTPVSFWRATHRLSIFYLLDMDGGVCAHAAIGSHLFHLRAGERRVDH